jgi:hypothetical protein
MNVVVVEREELGRNLTRIKNANTLLNYWVEETQNVAVFIL